MNEEDELAVLNSAAKRRKESIELFMAGGRNEMATRKQRSWRSSRSTFQADDGPGGRGCSPPGNSGSGGIRAKDFGKVMRRQ